MELLLVRTMCELGKFVDNIDCYVELFVFGSMENYFVVGPNRVSKQGYLD